MSKRPKIGNGPRQVPKGNAQGKTMLKSIPEAKKYVEITGFQNVTIDDAELFLKRIRKGKPQSVDVQFFNATLVATWEHLYFATLNALWAFKNRTNISKKLEIETLLYASAQRQIRKAIELMGFKHESANVAVVIIGKNPQFISSALSSIATLVGAQPDDTVLELSGNKTRCIKKTFDISEIEIDTIIEKTGADQALVDLVLERMALLPTMI
jgi:tRNA threonylcarbamoyladenosine modification (KEOPS) complex Cgi121 subunit